MASKEAGAAAGVGAVDGFLPEVADVLIEGLTLFSLLYVASLIVLFTSGLVITAWNARHPERRIQAREGRDRTVADIRSSTLQLAVTSGCLAFGLLMQSRGWVLFAPLELSWWSAPLLFGLSLVLHDAWFYWGHRLLHTKAFYRFHRPHHLNVTPTVWSNDSGSTVDTLFAHSYYALVLLVLPLPAAVFLAHRLFDQVSAMVGHAGHEHFAGASARHPLPFLCTVFHDQHHQYFVYNYANYFSWWDRICGTIHPTYDGRVAEFEAVYVRQAEDARLMGEADKARSS
ncbi:sterol desaturase family protein [Roseibium aestuarii]|uniref:Sterol desaturase family protein n=1 Tax=Roseibium aestuarii TaxID=2600299 RepID=A0ABW4JZJ8_9HYPH|nr:sterol desaturase family protein [Roseibium aestuarii]